MKKLLAILAVLAIAPLASASLGSLVLKADRQFSPHGHFNAELGEIITIQVIQTAPNPTGTGGAMSLTFDGEVVEVVNTTANPTNGFWLWGTDFGIKQSDIVGGISFAKIGDLSGRYSGGSYGIGSTNLLGGAYESTVQFSFIYESYWTEFIWTGVWDGVDMTGEPAIFIPEPITIALLGFGAMCIRRRK